MSAPRMAFRARSSVDLARWIVALATMAGVEPYELVGMGFREFCAVVQARAAARRS